MTVKQMRAFLAVAQSLSFAAACERLHLSQSALSLTIEGLEEGLGERLWSLARGIDDRVVQNDSRRQSISVENTYDVDLPDLSSCLAKLPELMETLAGRMARIDSSYRAGKPFVKVKFHDFTQTTLEQAGAGRDLESYEQLMTQAFNRGGKPVRLLGIGVRLLDLSGGNEQLEFSW